MVQASQNLDALRRALVDLPDGLIPAGRRSGSKATSRPFGMNFMARALRE
jgi:hypothetical protein